MMQSRGIGMWDFSVSLKNQYVAYILELSFLAVLLGGCLMMLVDKFQKPSSATFDV
jgi:hypothetical protein